MTCFFWQVITFRESGERWAACSWKLLEKCKTPITPPWVTKRHETAAALYDYLPVINNVRILIIKHAILLFLSFFFTHEIQPQTLHLLQLGEVFTASERGRENKCPVSLPSSFPGKQLTMTRQQLSYNRLAFGGFFFFSFSGYTLVPPLPDSLMGLVGQGRRRKIKLTSVTEGDWHLRALVIQ